MAHFPPGQIGSFSNHTDRNAKKQPHESPFIVDFPPATALLESLKVNKKFAYQSLPTGCPHRSLPATQTQRWILFGFDRPSCCGSNSCVLPTRKSDPSKTRVFGAKSSFFRWKNLWKSWLVDGNPRSLNEYPLQKWWDWVDEIPFLNEMVPFFKWQFAFFLGGGVEITDYGTISIISRPLMGINCSHSDGEISKKLAGGCSEATKIKGGISEDVLKSCVLFFFFFFFLRLLSLLLLSLLSLLSLLVVKFPETKIHGLYAKRVPSKNDSSGSTWKYISPSSKMGKDSTILNPYTSRHFPTW